MCINKTNIDIIPLLSCAYKSSDSTINNPWRPLYNKLVIVTQVEPEASRDVATPILMTWRYTIKLDGSILELRMEVNGMNDSLRHVQLHELR